MKLLLISSVIPEETTATELVLFRHFAAAADEIELAIASDHPNILHGSENISIYPNPLLLRLLKTRFSKLAHTVRHWPLTFDCRALNIHLQHHRPDAILTVAHGELYQLALQTAQQQQIPLITFFHDWLPDMTWTLEWFKPFLENRFRQLYKKSQVAFCVSEEMKQSLGEHPHGIVLPPIPVTLEIPEVSFLPKQSLPFQLAYAGNLSDCYRHLIQQLGMELQQYPEFQLQCFGQSTDWSEETIQQFQDWGIYKGFVPRDTLTQQQLQAHALLVVMSFESHVRHRMETSFPSKLVEYCQLGKPIVVWGPESCTAVQWAKRYDAAEIVTLPNANAVVEVLQRLSQNSERQRYLGSRARQLATEFFNPRQIQQQFLNGLKVAVTGEGV